jgi:peptidoglycan/xylan/chitin deacetylase (PgdA/CDA1 family)
MRDDSSTRRFKVLAKNALRAGAVGEAVRRIGALRGRSLVLAYHRVAAGESGAPRVVPCVPQHVFRRQLEALADVGEIVPLEMLVRNRDRHARPRFGLTFDDDYLDHFEHALPTLQVLDAPATFFLSGRALHGLGSYWFELLERLIASRGVERVGRLLGTVDNGVEGLIEACENEPSLHKVVEAAAPDVPRHLDRDHIAALVSAGMTVGFHTLHHEILTRLAVHEVEEALTLGRHELEAIVGRPLLHFAYPHGKADRRTADLVRDAGYVAGWTGRPLPMGRRDDRFLLGRWEPGSLEVDDFLVGMTLRLARGGHR